VTDNANAPPTSMLPPTVTIKKKQIGD